MVSWAVDYPVSDLNKLTRLLIENQDKNFVRRILQKDQWPSIPGEKGQIQTHYMSAEFGPDGKAYAYPNITWDEEAQQLVRREGREALDHALSTNDALEFNTIEEADWFSREYKQYWDEYYPEIQ